MAMLGATLDIPPFTREYERLPPCGVEAAINNKISQCKNTYGENDQCCAPMFSDPICNWTLSM